MQSAHFLDFIFWKYSRDPLLSFQQRPDFNQQSNKCVGFYILEIFKRPLPSSCSLLVTMVRSLLTDTSILLPHHHFPLSQTLILILTWRDLNPHLHPCDFVSSQAGSIWKHTVEKSQTSPQFSSQTILTIPLLIRRHVQKYTVEKSYNKLNPICHYLSSSLW